MHCVPVRLPDTAVPWEHGRVSAPDPGTRRIGALGVAIAALVWLCAAPAAARVPADLLYFALVDTIVVMDPDDGSVTWLEPQSATFMGLAFDHTGKLLATANRCVEPTCYLGIRHHLLLEVDPLTGEIREEIGEVRDASGSPVVVLALSARPGSDLLYGLGAVAPYVDLLPSFLKLWSIDPSTGAASLIGSPAGCPEIGCRSVTTSGPFTSLAFGPDGTLYSGLSLESAPEQSLLTLDADSGALISSQPIDRTVWGGGPLAVRSDGTVFVHSAAVSVRLPRPCSTCPPPDPPFEFFPSYVATIDQSSGVATEVAAGVSTPFGYYPTDLSFSPVVVVSIAIDIRPGDGIESINFRSRGVVPVAILGSEMFDVADVDVTTLAFGPGGAPPAHWKGGHHHDANHDGVEDLLVHFENEQSGIAFGDTEACVTGELLDGTPFEGCDAIVTLPPGCGEGFDMALLGPAFVWLHRRRQSRSRDEPPGTRGFRAVD